MLPDNLFDHLTLLQAFKRSLNIFWAHLGVFLGLAATTIPTGIALIFAFVTNIFIDDPNVTNAQVTGLRIILVLALFVHLLVETLMRGATVLAAAQVYTGHKPRYCESLKGTTKHVCALFCTSILLSLITGVCLLPAIVLFYLAQENEYHNPILIAVWAIVSAISVIWVLYFVASMTSVFPVIMVENESALGSVRRSWELASGSRCFILCALLILMIVHQLLSMIPPFGVASLVTIPFDHILVTVIYMSLRIDKEGLNRDVLCRDLGVEIGRLPVPTRDVEEYAVHLDMADKVETGVALELV